MSGGRDRDEFSEPLEDAEEEGLKEGHWIGRVEQEDGCEMKIVG